MLSDNIRTIRKSRSFTQEELAARLHVTRQTISKWEKGYSVPDAALLSRMAEILEVPVTELLGESAGAPADPGPLVEQLARLNEQLAVKNRRTARIWKIVGITLAAIVLLFVAVLVSGTILYRAQPREPAGSIEWTCELEGETYICGLEYTKDYRILSGFGDADTALADRIAGAGVDPTEQGDARRARTVLYDWFEAQGGTVEVTGHTGLPLE